MTRIIAGQAGSIRLDTPGAITRPTSDRVREAIFSALESRLSLTGTTVLDLYAGSGALGLEALSRGTQTLIASERDRTAFAVLRANTTTVTAALDHPVETDIRCQSAEQALKRLPPESVDIAFLDPPYDLDNDALVSVIEAVPLHPEGLVVVERSAKTPAPQWPEGMQCLSTKTYGDTVVYVLSR